VNLIDSKVIQTELEKEIFIDQSSNIELTNFRYPDKNFPFYEVMISIGMLRIRNNEYYGTKKELFGLRMSEDQQSIFIFETDKQNIFALKNEKERQAASELIEYILTNSTHFNELVSTTIDQLKQANVISTSEIKETKGKLELLERLLTIHSEDITFPSQKRITA
jgi:TATA-box binding protein (TBP) (component of TFIID and TFIIIB)